MELFNKNIGGDNPALIIAEAGVNHNGDLGLAKELIDVAVDAGADAVKFQTLNAAKYISRFAPKARYQLEHTDRLESQVEMVRKYELSRAQHLELIEHCRGAGVPFFSTAFDHEGVDLLAELGMGLYKVPSGEITNLPLLEHIAAKGKPIILSTGMSYLGEVERAVQAIRAQGVDEVVLLHCVSNYPARPADSNLRAMQTMCRALALPVGYSDHTPGIEVAVAAVAMGACVIEKHYTVDQTLPGPDHRASLEPAELKAMVSAIRNVESAMGDGVKRPMHSEENTRDVARKSLVAAAAIGAGTTISAEMLHVKRPGTGISPVELEYVVGRKTLCEIEGDEPLAWEMLA